MPYGQASHEMRAFILQPGAGLSLNNPFGGQLVFKLRGEQSNGAMTVIESVAAPGHGPPLHIHQLQDEWRYVLDGEVRFRLIDDVVLAPAGACVFIPRGVAHTWQAVGRERSVMLAILAPSALEGFFEQYAGVAGRAASVDTFRGHAPVAGMTGVGPPLAESHPNRATTSVEG